MRALRLVAGENGFGGVAINNHGDVFGIRYAQDNQAFLWESESGAVTRVMETGRNDLWFSYWLTDSRHAAGQFGHHGFAFRWNDEDGWSVLPFPPGMRDGYTIPTGVNERGQISGTAAQWSDPWPTGIIWERDSTVSVVGPGAVWDINERGDVVGILTNDERPQPSPFVRFADGTRIDIPLGDDLGTHGDGAFEIFINDHGVIVGAASERNADVLSTVFTWSLKDGLVFHTNDDARHIVHAWNNLGQAVIRRADGTNGRLLVMDLSHGITHDLGPYGTGWRRLPVAFNENGRAAWLRDGARVWDEVNGVRLLADLVPLAWRQSLERVLDINDRGQILMIVELRGKHPTDRFTLAVIDLPTEGASPLHMRVERGSLASGNLASLANAGDGNVMSLRSLDAAPIALAFEANSRVHRPQSIDVIVNVNADRSDIAFDLELLNHATGIFDRVGGGLPEPATGELRADLIDARPYIDAEGRVKVRLRAESIAAEARPFTVTIDGCAVEVR